jgi:hypothetical protein
MFIYPQQIWPEKFCRSILVQTCQHGIDILFCERLQTEGVLLLSQSRNLQIAVVG